MFYIEKRRRKLDIHLALAHIGPAAIVFVAFFGLTIWSYYNAREMVADTRAQVLTRNLEQAQSAIQGRLTTYENILRAGSGLFSASDSVTRTEWKTFVDNFDLSHRYPGVQGVGYIDIIPAAERANHTARRQTEALPHYEVYPSGERPLYTSVEYIEPSNERNQKALGYDMYTETQRKQAMELASRSGQTSVTGIVTLIQDSAAQQPGFLMYVPLYNKTASQVTDNDRQASTTGYIFAQFRAADLLNQTLGNTDQNFGFQIHDGDISPATLLYQSASFPRINNSASHPSVSRNFEINNRHWTVSGVVASEVIPVGERNRPQTVLWAGILFSLFVAGFIYLLLLNRTRLVSNKEEQEIREAKDELLALASHQLRTPATGVKQYIGLLREGFAGKLTDEQQGYLDKAHASNERQLGTINEMLVVAHADAGTIELTPQRFDLAGMLRDILEEHQPGIAQRDQTLRIHIPKKRLFIYADGRYLRMAVENIISNATKYTPPGGTITVRLSAYKHRVRITVKDTGVGVSEKDYALLFKKFCRIPNDLTNQVTGSGIGLYLAQKIAHAHRGSINFTSQPGVGSTCTIMLPSKPER